MRISAGGMLPEIRARLIQVGMMIRIKTTDITRGILQSLHASKIYIIFLKHYKVTYGVKQTCIHIYRKGIQYVWCYGQPEPEQR